MKVSVTEAKGQLTDLVRRAEQGDEIILTRHGQPTVQLVPLPRQHDRSTRRKILETARGSAIGKSSERSNAARSQDFLYGPDGLPR